MALFRIITIVFSVFLLTSPAESLSASKEKPVEATADEVPSLEQKLKAEPDNPVILQSLGRYYYRTENLNDAKNCAVRLLELARQTGDREFSEMWGRYILGAVQFDMRDHTEALRNLEIARGIAESHDNNDALSTIYNALGLYYMFTNNDPFTATTFYYKALDATRKEKDLKREAPLLANLAAAYLTMEDPSGLRLAEQAVELSEKYDPGFTIKPRIILTETYIMADSTEKAWKMLEKIRTHESEADREQFASLLQYSEAALALKENRLDEAIVVFRRLLAEEQNDPSSVASISLSLADALEKKGLDGEAIAILEKALRNSRDEHFHIHSSKVMKALVRMYAKTGRKDSAIAMGEEYVAYSDSLYTLGHHRTLQENRIREEVFAKERQIDEQKLQLASKNHKIVLLTIGLGLLSLLLLFIFFAIRKREKLYTTIVTRNSEFLKRDRQQADEIAALKKKINQNFPANISEDNVSAKKSDDDANKELMDRFVAYMEESKGFADPHITIAGVAKECGTNRTYLSKAINAATGKTFLQIINDYRMRRAVEILSDKDSDIPLKQLAADLGYNSMSTFYSIFNNYTGMTPAKYREHVRCLVDDASLPDA